MNKIPIEINIKPIHNVQERDSVGKIITDEIVPNTGTRLMKIPLFVAPIRLMAIK